MRLGVWPETPALQCACLSLGPKGEGSVGSQRAVGSDLPGSPEQCPHGPPTWFQPQKAPQDYCPDLRLMEGKLGHMENTDSPHCRVSSWIWWLWPGLKAFRGMKIVSPGSMAASLLCSFLTFLSLRRGTRASLSTCLPRVEPGAWRFSTLMNTLKLGCSPASGARVTPAFVDFD